MHSDVTEHSKPRTKQLFQYYLKNKKKKCTPLNTQLTTLSEVDHVIVRRFIHCVSHCGQITKVKEAKDAFIIIMLLTIFMHEKILDF